MHTRRILKVVPFFPPSLYAGGVENLAKGWSDSLVRDYRCQVYLLSSEVLGEKYRLLCVNGIQQQHSYIVIRRTKAIVLLTRPIMPFLAMSCLSMVKEVKPEIVHLYIPLAQDLLISKIFKKCDFPIVLTYAADPILGESSFLKSMIEKAYHATIISTLDLADYVISTTERYVMISPILRLVPRKKIRVVYQGVDTRYFRPSTEDERRRAKEGLRKKYNISNGTPIIGFVGRLVPYKGLRLLLSIAECLKSYAFFIVGEGPLRYSLEKAAGKNVFFLGRVSDEMLRELYWAFDLTINPSINRAESIPLTTLESMACGTPVVVTDVGGNKELFERASHVFGVLTEPEKEKLISAIDEVLNKREEFAMGARLEAMKYDWKQVTKALYEVYQELK
jgi:glycosyltransferase involved in cell wall biosynthesis